MFTQEDFYALVELFRARGYTVTVRDDGYLFADVRGKNIRGGFAEVNEDSYRQLSGRFAADHEECFDKWSKAPLIVDLPTDMDELFSHLEVLGSKEGYEISNSYSYLDNNPFPCVMPW